MALPNPFQKLKHGALLCKKNFNTFVETFNFLVDFAQNIRGDGDANGSGSIVVDRSVPDRPVIRSKINMDYPFGGGGLIIPSCFEFAGIDNGLATFANPYYSIGGKSYELVNSSVLVSLPCIVVLEISSTDGSAILTSCLDFSNLQSSQASMLNYLIPICSLNSEGNVTLDWRKMPTAAMGEF